MELLEFYPTPVSLLEKILKGINWRKVGTVLEPSAGKGDIISYIHTVADKYPYYNSSIQFDCIEKDATLQKTLIGNDYRLVHDDFLSFNTFKCYDMIIMNPPFSEGDKHLSKALDMQERAGGDVICILNAETIRNPYSNLRRALVQRLESAGAIIEYMQQEFSSAERTTDVEIAVIKVHFEKPAYASNIFEGLKKKAYAESGYTEKDITDLAPKDFIEAIVKAYEIEVEAGVNFINEYKALMPHFMPNLRKEDNVYAHPILELKSNDFDLSINSYVEQVRMKYWRALFQDKRITGQMTSNLQHSYISKVKELKDYEFSVYNIKSLQVEMSKELIKGIEDCIIELFNELTDKHSWYPECEKNIHYFNGWRTNKSWIINKKVIIPIYNVWDTYDKTRYQPDDYRVVEKLADIEKALDYLDGGITADCGFWPLERARKTAQTKDIRLKHFTVSFFKKGTCHITFNNDELLKKFNIFGSQKKGWLPPSYGKKRYTEMDAEEKAVIDEFEGEMSYNKTMADPEYYLFDASSTLMIEEKVA